MGLQAPHDVVSEGASMNSLVGWLVGSDRQSVLAAQGFRRQLSKTLLVDGGETSKLHKSPAVGYLSDPDAGGTF
jgi:hypothetical protein